jgi:hypothetical protein
MADHALFKMVFCKNQNKSEKQQKHFYVEKMVATCSLELVWAQNILTQYMLYKYLPFVLTGALRGGLPNSCTWCVKCTPQAPVKTNGRYLYNKYTTNFKKSECLKKLFYGNIDGGSNDA